MKRAVIVILILFSLTYTAYAQEDYGNYSFLEMLVQINATMDVDYGERPVIEYFNAKSSLRPINDVPSQVIFEKKYSAIPDTAEIFTDENNSINFKWLKETPEKFYMDISIGMATSNEVKKVKEKIKFPPENIPEEIIAYTKPTDFIDITPEIKEKANEIVSGQTGYYEAVFALAEWVEQNINYSLDTLTENAVQKSSWVMENKYGVCDELTNLFISLARSVGIPARFVSGQVYSNRIGEFGSHGWAEVYFPGYGWLPFDVTFKQFGWIDPSHAKISEQPDSGIPAMEYEWKSSGAEFNSRGIGVSTSIIRKGNTIIPPVSIEVEAINENAGFGSYVPIMATITNPNDYYVPELIVIDKAPEIIGKNFKNILLGPKEEVKAVWIVKVPANLDSKYIYTSEIEAVDSYGNKAAASLTYSSDFEAKSKEAAETEAKELSQAAKKTYLREANLICNFEKDKFYFDEQVNAKCLIENIGNTPLKKIKVCMLNNCKNEELGIGERETVELNENAGKMESGKIRFSIETGSQIKSEYKKLKIINDPKFSITELSPKTIVYGRKANLTLSTTSESRAYNISIEIVKGTGTEVNSLEGKGTLIFSIDTRDINSDTLKLRWKYNDETGREYQEREKEFAKIINRPWHAYFSYLYRNLLSETSIAASYRQP